MFTAGSDFQATEVTVVPFAGTGANGDVFGPAVTRQVVVSDARKLVRDGTGQQVVSETTLFDDPDQAATYPPDSVITLPTRTARVILVKTHVIGDPDVDHVEVSCT